MTYDNFIRKLLTYAVFFRLRLSLYHPHQPHPPDNAAGHRPSPPTDLPTDTGHDGLLRSGGRGSPSDRYSL